jgi:hypothetical protein
MMGIIKIFYGLISPLKESGAKAQIFLISGPRPEGRGYSVAIQGQFSGYSVVSYSGFDNSIVER